MEEIKPALAKELLEGNQDLADWVVNRWVFKHGEVYSHFAERLEAIRLDFATLEALNQAESEQILAGAKEAFGAKPVYFFSVLNDVVFPPSVIEQLRHAAEAENVTVVKVVPQGDALADEKQRKEITRLEEKYQQKIAGIMTKYTKDVEALKTQIRALQKRLG